MMCGNSLRCELTPVSLSGSSNPGQKVCSGFPLLLNQFAPGSHHCLFILSPVTHHCPLGGSLLLFFLHTPTSPSATAGMPVQSPDELSALGSARAPDLEKKLLCSVNKGRLRTAQSSPCSSQLVCA